MTCIRNVVTIEKMGQEETWEGREESMDFVRYQHVEHLSMGGSEIEGILDGHVFVFPKIDGANHCVYYDKVLDRVAYASRNQLLSEGYDTTGFWHFADSHKELAKFVTEHPTLRIYGEWLTPHTIRAYTDDSWNKFYIFDIWDDTIGCWLPPHVVHLLLYGVCGGDIQIIPAIAEFDNPTKDDIISAMDKDTYLLKEGMQGEGVVIKNFEYRNPHGRMTWAKIVREEFKSKFKSPNKGEKVILPEEQAVFDSVTKEFVSKEFHKFTTDRGVEWNMSMTPDFLKNIWQAWWEDCSFATLSGLKTVDMKAVRSALSKAVMGKLRTL